MLVTAGLLLGLAGGVLAANFIGGEKKIERRLNRLYALDDPRFVRELGVLLGPSFLEGNRPQVLRNGDEIFPAMLDAIRVATTTITFETYIYWSGAIGAEFVQALAERKTCRSCAPVAFSCGWRRPFPCTTARTPPERARAACASP